MDNRSIAQLLEETADLLEIDGADSFHIRSYRRAAEAIQATTTALSDIAHDAKKLLAIPGIGKAMAANIRAIPPENLIYLDESGVITQMT